MAGGLMRYDSVLIAGVCMAVASTVYAQTLRDPTRPAMVANSKGVAARAEQSGWILQSVLISPERRYAIINGEVVPLGGEVAGAELVAIAPERVTLRTPEGLRVLHLFPDVTRLGAATLGAGIKQPEESEGQQDTKVQRSGSAGIKK